MHKLHTTLAFVLKSYPHGESNRVYKLFTRELGLLYAHGQGVRELKSRNKYSLQTGDLSEVTLVRGKNVWRITGAKSVHFFTFSKRSKIVKGKILDFIGKSMQAEDVSHDVFDIIISGYFALTSNDGFDSELIEIITMLRIIDKIGFLKKTGKNANVSDFINPTHISNDLLSKVKNEKIFLIKIINEALEEVW